MVDRIAEIRQRVENSTPGSWEWRKDFGDEGDTGLALASNDTVEILGAYNWHCCSFRDDPNVSDADAEFIAHSREDIPYLLARLAEAEAKIARTLALIDGGIQEEATPQRILSVIESFLRSASPEPKEGNNE